MTQPTQPTQPTARTTWQDGDPYLEAIAAAVWEHCAKEYGSGIVIDDPRNIAEAVAATARATVLREAADEAERENADCPVTAAGRPCPPCAARAAVATKLRRIGDAR